MPPILVVGTKLDQAQIVRNSSSLRSTSQIALQFRADEINLVIFELFNMAKLAFLIIFTFKDCMQARSFAPATSNSIKLAKFLDKLSLILNF